MSKQRYEKEIEDILSKFDQETGRTEKPPREDRQVGAFRPVSTSRSKPSFSFNWKRMSAGQYMLAAFGVALLAVFIRSAVPPLASLLVILAVVLFLVPILLYHSTGTTTGGWSTREEKRWRGQVIDFNTRRDVTNGPLATIKRWWKRR